MDDRLQQCPNCGSAVLPSARFCVTCGIRLPEPAGSAGNTEPAGWSRPAEDIWIAEAPATDEDSNDLTSFEPSTDAGTAEAEAALPDSPETDERAGGEPQATDEVIALPADSASAGMSDARDETPDATEEWLDADGELVGPEGELAPSALPATEDDERGWTGETIGQSLDDAGSSDDAVFEPFSLHIDDEAGTDYFEPAGWDDGEDSLNDAGEPESSGTLGERDEMTETTPDTRNDSVAAGEQSAALERASDLLDQLRDLLPQLTVPAAQEPSLDRASLREQAIATRGERSFDDFASLREVIHDAVHRPRDIEVVLRLSQHADDINALLAERDRLQTAFDDLLRGLDQ